MEDVLKALIIVLSSFVLLGCAAISGRREALDQRKKSPPLTVSKEQYDQLLKKYEVLLKQGQKSSTTAGIKTNDLDQIAKDLEGSNLKLSPRGKIELAETVDVFGQKTMVKKQIPSSAMGTSVDDKMRQLISTEAQQIIKARGLVYQNQHDAAMNLLVNLENSSSRQVQVRAKYLIGEVLFNQGSYDQAMQVFEGIIENYAFSGVVFHALTKLVACTHKLKLTEKYQRYYSMLHDIFQST